MGRMSDDDYWYYREEAAREQYNEEIREEALREFHTDRLQSFYLENATTLMVPLLRALRRAKSLDDSTAAFTFAAIAVELCVRTVLLKPLVYGLVHDGAAGLITKLLLDQAGALRHRQLMTMLLREHGEIDLDTYRCRNANEPVLQQVDRLVTLRNNILHKGEEASEQQSAEAINVADELLTELVPSLLDHLGLKMRADGTIRRQSAYLDHLEK
jgi:hypothetical protein